MLELILQRLDDEKMNASTKKQHVRYVTMIMEAFPQIDSLDGLNNSYAEILKYGREKYAKDSTYRNFISTLSKMFKMYELSNHEKVLKALKDANTKLTFEQDDKERIPPEEAERLLRKLCEVYNYCAEHVDDSEEYTEYDCHYLLCQLFFEYGAQRPGELLNMRIVNENIIDMMGDRMNGINYINIDTMNMVVNNHKTAFKDGIRVVDVSKLDKDVLRKGLTHTFIVNKHGRKYEQQSRFTEGFFSRYGANYMTVRKLVVSLKIAQMKKTGNLEPITTLAYIHGHSLEIMRSYYNKFNLKGYENLIITDEED